MQITEERETKLRSANDWIREAKKRPIPRALFGEFWRDGEIAILFGDTGKGKTALALQIAESLAKGRGIAPFKAGARSQTVLYLDIEMNDKQFERRYAADHDGGKARFLHKHYEFRDDLIREEFDPAELWMESGKRPAEVFYGRLRGLVEESEVTVVIIDSLNCLKRTYYGSREALELMWALKKLRRELNLSILVLVQTPKRPDSLPIDANSLLSLRMLCSRTDSVFGIGQSRTGPASRYLKRVRAVSDTIHFDGLHVPEFRLKKIGGNFLGFEFERFAPEIELISDMCNHEQWETIEKIKGLSDGGKSIRDIAAEIELPKTTVHRLLQMWRPPVREAAAEVKSEGSEPANAHYFPGREEFDAALADPKFKKMFEGEDEECWALQREYGIIQNACARARKEYRKKGTFTPLDDDPEYDEFLTFGPAGRPPGDPFDREDATALASPGTASFADADKPFDPMAHLKLALNGYGREIFVEKEDARGKPIIWYSTRKNGKFTRWVRDGSGGIHGFNVDGPVCMLNARPDRQPRD